MFGVCGVQLSSNSHHLGFRVWGLELEDLHVGDVRALDEKLHLELLRDLGLGVRGLTR